MTDKLQMFLLAISFAAVGSGGTAAGFMLAQRAQVHQGSATADTATPRASMRAAARKARAERMGAGRSASRGRGRTRSAKGATSRGQGRSWAAMADDLDLTEAQQLAWQQMMVDIRTTCTADPGDQGDTTLELLSSTVAVDEADPEALHALIEARLEARRTAAHCVLAEALEFRAELTPEQRAAIATRVSELQTRRQAWLDAWSE